jgi:hypothetical protein
MRAVGHILLLWLMALSMLTTTAVHAQEFPTSAAVDCSGFVHSEGDSDESQGDADKAVPHHHTSCHSGFASVPQATNNLLVLSPAKVRNRMFDSPSLDRWAIGPDLRPPIA